MFHFVQSFWNSVDIFNRFEFCTLMVLTDFFFKTKRDTLHTFRFDGKQVVYFIQVPIEFNEIKLTN